MRAKSWAIAIMTACLSAWAQAPKNAPPAQVVTIDQPDANRTREEFSRLLGHYPPTLRNVLAIDPSLLGDQTYLAPYPALATFLNQHPEIVRDPQYYVGEPYNRYPRQDNSSPSERVWERAAEQIGIFGGFAMAIGLLMWLIRTTMDYRRWNRLTNIQTNVHTKLVDRFTGNEELLAYIQSPAGSKFLESAPIALDAGPRNVGAPMGRILWSVQAGLVLMAGGIGLVAVAAQVADVAAQPIRALGILGVALGLGFLVSAGASYVISRRLGLIEPKVEPPPTLG